MKKATTLFLIFATVSILVSCGKTPINGKLDGMWHLTDIEYTDSTSQNIKEERVYYSFQLHLISLRKANSGIEYLGRFNHSGDSLIVNEFRVKGEENKLVEADDLKVFGMNTTVTRFGLEELSSSRMILKSTYARLYFRKF